MFIYNTVGNAPIVGAAWPSNLFLDFVRTCAHLWIVFYSFGVCYQLQGVLMSKESGKSMNSKKLAKYTAFQASKPEQLELFFQDADGKYSHTIEFYDSIPYLVFKRPDRVEGQFLQHIEKEFGCRGKNFSVVVTPARIIDKDGVGRDYFPGTCEEVVEHVLRKFSADGRAVYLDDIHSFSFTIYALQQECIRLGHSYDYDQLKKALRVLTNTGIEVSDEEGKSMFSLSPFESFGMKTLEEQEGAEKKVVCFVRYNILVTNSINNLQYRQLDYQTNLKLKSALARWLHRRLSHTFSQASYNNSYDIKLSTILRDSPLDSSNRPIRKSLADVTKCLEELKSSQILMSYEASKIYDLKDPRKIIDCLFILKAHMPFIGEMIKANTKSKELKSKVTGKKGTKVEDT